MGCTRTSTQGSAVSTAEAAVGPSTEATTARRSPWWLVAAGAFIGVGATYAGSVGLFDAMIVRIILVAAGLLVLFHVLDAVLQRIARRVIDTGLVLASVWLILLVVAAVVADWLPLAEGRDISKTLTSPTL